MRARVCVCVCARGLRAVRLLRRQETGGSGTPRPHPQVSWLYTHGSFSLAVSAPAFPIAGGWAQWCRGPGLLADTRLCHAPWGAMGAGGGVDEGPPCITGPFGERGSPHPLPVVRWWVVPRPVAGLDGKLLRDVFVTLVSAALQETGARGVGGIPGLGRDLWEPGFPKPPSEPA